MLGTVLDAFTHNLLFNLPFYAMRKVLQSPGFERDLTLGTLACSDISPQLLREHVSLIHQEMSMKPSAMVP